jgi:hypothetical protein
VGDWVDSIRFDSLQFVRCGDIHRAHWSGDTERLLINKKKDKKGKEKQKEQGQGNEDGMSSRAKPIAQTGRP